MSLQAPITTTTINAFVAYLRAHGIPMELRYKSESWGMRVLGTFLFFNRGFMDSYITTLGSRVYLPSPAWRAQTPAQTLLEILAHEAVHIADRKRVGVLFSLGYVFPQVLALGALLAVLAFWRLEFLLSLLALLFLLPLPAPFRARWERRGYAMSAAMLYWLSGSLEPVASSREFFRAQFLGWPYYRMTWSARRHAEWWVLLLRNLPTQAFFQGAEGLPYRIVYDFLHTHRLARVRIDRTSEVPRA